MIPPMLWLTLDRSSPSRSVQPPNACAHIAPVGWSGVSRGSQRRPALGEREDGTGASGISLLAQAPEDRLTAVEAVADQHGLLAGVAFAGQGAERAGQLVALSA